MTTQKLKWSRYTDGWVLNGRDGRWAGVSIVNYGRSWEQRFPVVAVRLSAKPSPAQARKIAERVRELTLQCERELSAPKKKASR